MFEVRQIISVFSKMCLERKKFGNHCFRETSHFGFSHFCFNFGWYPL